MLFISKVLLVLVNKQAGNLDLKGNVTPLFEDTENRFGWAIPSLDGSRVAYWKQYLSSNVWLLRDF